MCYRYIVHRVEHYHCISELLHFPQIYNSVLFGDDEDDVSNGITIFQIWLFLLKVMVEAPLPEGILKQLALIYAINKA